MTHGGTKGLTYAGHERELRNVPRATPRFSNPSVDVAPVYNPDDEYE